MFLRSYFLVRLVAFIWWLIPIYVPWLRKISTMWFWPFCVVFLTATVSRRECGRPASGDNQGISWCSTKHILLLCYECFLCPCENFVGSWYSNSWGNKMHEPQLYWVQVSSDKGSSMAQGIHMFNHVYRAILHTGYCNCCLRFHVSEAHLNWFYNLISNLHFEFKMHQWLTEFLHFYPPDFPQENASGSYRPCFSSPPILTKSSLLCCE